MPSFLETLPASVQVEFRKVPHTNKKSGAYEGYILVESIRARNVYEAWKSFYALHPEYRPGIKPGVFVKVVSANF